MSPTISNTTDITKYSKAFFGYATISIIITEVDGEIVDINPFGLKEFGYSQKDLVGKKIDFLIPQRLHHQHHQYREKFINNSSQEPSLQSIELFCVKNDGKEFPIEIGLGHYCEDSIHNIIVFIKDISVRRKAESELEKLNAELEVTIEERTKDLKEALLKLKESKNELRNGLIFQKTLLDTAGAMIIATDEKGIINLFNPWASTLLGYTEEEILGKTTPVLFHNKKDIKRKRSQLSVDYGHEIKGDFDVLVDKAVRNIHEEEVYSLVTKTGESFPVSLSVTALRNNEGAITGFMAIAVDITERVQAERNLKKTEHLFLQLIENYPDGIISIIDRNLNFVYTGGELHKKLNANIGSLLGKEVFPFFPNPIRNVILPLLQRVFKNKTFITELELPFPVLNGTYIMDAFPLLEEDGVVNYIGVIIKNISEMKLIEKGLRSDLKIERDLNELKSRFVTMASHEFRTPLSTVLSSSYLIEKYTASKDQPKREKHLHRIVKSVNMLTDILNDFLSLGKIEEGKIRTNFSAFNLQEIIVSTIDEIKNNLKNGQRIKYTHEGDPDVYLDLSLMKHILMNLVSNASKFSSESTTIKIKTVQKKNSILLSVKDEGIGISPEDQKHLMERFFRAANAQNIQGTGLGLHIVARYAEMMGGKLEFKSELGNGSEFIITLESVLS